MTLDTLLLSRIQFGFTIGFHIMFPTLNIGLAVFLTIMEALWLKTRDNKYLEICKFYTKIFALTFGMGIVSGVVLSYEIGTNFGKFIYAVGEVLGPLFSYEVLSAFFLEAGFLGIMLFGWNRVPPRAHFFATTLVTIGTIISAFWIISANSWMQTPVGYTFSKGKYHVASWFDAVFNPSFMPRFTHMIFASLVTACFVIAGISAWHLLKQKHQATAKTSLKFAMIAALILAPTQLLIGDVVGLNIHRYQPTKTAAIEGLWQTQKGAPLVLIGWPNTKEQKNDYAIHIPYGASLINTHHLEGELRGLDAFPRDQWPVIPITFLSFRIMVGIGLLFIGTAIYGCYLLARKRLYDHQLFLKFLLLLSPLGFVAAIFGWLTAESGRQPWVVYGLMRTGEGASIVPASQVMFSLTLFIVVYGIIFAFYLYYLLQFIDQGPTRLNEEPMTISYMPTSYSQPHSQGKQHHA